MHLVLTIWNGNTHKSALPKLDSVTSKLVTCKRKLVLWLKTEHVGFHNYQFSFLIITRFLQCIKNCTLKIELWSSDVLRPTLRYWMGGILSWFHLILQEESYTCLHPFVLISSTWHIQTYHNLLSASSIVQW
jgi:hypothetical protein